MNRRCKLTAAIEKMICDFIRAGGFPHVAAEAAGIPRDVFDAWLQRGASRRKTTFNKPFIAFREAVTEAQAEARLAAEIAAHQEHPLTWLKQGPGKETPTSPGWTTPIKPQILTTTNNQVNVLLTSEMQGLIAALLQILAPYPEARAAVAKAIASVEEPRRNERTLIG